MTSSLKISTCFNDRLFRKSLYITSGNQNMIIKSLVRTGSNYIQQWTPVLILLIQLKLACWCTLVSLASVDFAHGKTDISKAHLRKEKKLHRHIWNCSLAKKIRMESIGKIYPDQMAKNYIISMKSTYHSLLSSSCSSPNPKTWSDAFLSFLSSLLAISPTTLAPLVSEIPSSSKSSPISSEYAYLPTGHQMVIQKSEAPILQKDFSKPTICLGYVRSADNATK